MQIKPLLDAHIEEAAGLFVTAHRQAREFTPALLNLPEKSEKVAAMLGDLLKRFPGVAALRGGTLCGYLIGFALSEFMSPRRGVYCPEWGHAVAGEDRREIYRGMYAALSPQWAENGCYTHAITLFANDTESLDVWFRNGFGLNGVDAVRDLTPVAVACPENFDLRRAGSGDVDRLLSLVYALHRHLADGPTFLPMLELPRREDLMTWLDEPGHALWLAQCGDEAIAYMQCQTAEQENRYVLSGVNGVAINGAYTDPRWRGTGVASVLLNHVLAWAREQGRTRCSVDFESQNIEANRFWLRHFAPACYSVLRRLDERVAWANRKRPIETCW